MTPLPAILSVCEVKRPGAQQVAQDPATGGSRGRRSVQLAVPPPPSDQSRLPLVAQLRTYLHLHLHTTIHPIAPFSKPALRASFTAPAPPITSPLSDSR